MKNSHQTTPHILMVRPARFGFNEETAANNAFQVNDTSLAPEEIQHRALQEFDGFVQLLRAAGIGVIVADDTPTPVKPDAVFPNNWVTFHEDGTVITYPMYAPLRRLERQERILDDLARQFEVGQRIRLEEYEAAGRYLEGTGSMIPDRDHHLVYACTGPRTDAGLLAEFCRVTGYHPVTFRAVDGQGKDIYHTNVMMAMGETFVVICLDTIRDGQEREKVVGHLHRTGKDIIEISLDQMMAFAGNMLQVRNFDGKTFLVMSEQAYRSLTPAQVARIEHHTAILYAPIYTIETYGGGSARCMMAEVFLPEKQHR